MNLRTELPTAENSSNFNAVADAATKAGTTLENLKAAVAGETGASAKYAACAKLAKEKGYEHPVMIVNISGRGDKDMNTAGKWFGYLTDEQAAALEANGATGNNA